jgi:hypothetical protein
MTNRKELPMTDSTYHPPLQLRTLLGIAATFIVALFIFTFLFFRLLPDWPPTSSHDGVPLNTPTLSSPTTTHDGESAIYPGTDADYRDGAWWVDGVKVTGVDCPTEDSCYPMEHGEGTMIHETTP